MSKFRIELVLAGHFAGKSVTLNGFRFTNGRTVIEDAPEAVANAVKYFEAYQAYPVGSPELAAAQARDKANGIGDLSAGDPALSSGDGNQQSGPGASSVPAALSDGQSGPGPVIVGGDTNRSGHPDAGVPLGEGKAPEGGSAPPPPAVNVSENLVKAVLALDPANVDHWTEEGIPAMAAVEAAYGSNGITRRDVDQAVPGWNRDKAQGAKDAADMA